jgi:alanyl-tRNA synthetase
VLGVATFQLADSQDSSFGETYPNPVRCVTLEFSMDEILSDIENPKWRSTSVEFCGGT